MTALTLETETTQAAGLLKLLLREQELLVAGEVATLQALLHQKSSLIQSLQHSSKLRYQKLALQGLLANEQGMQAWLAKHPEANGEWETLRRILEEAKETNRVNGLLIQKHHGRTQSTLGMLQQARNGDSGQLYGPSGLTRHPLQPGNSIAS